MNDIYNEVNIVASQETLNKFNTLYEDTYKSISKYIVCNCQNIEDVKDILQNIYLDAFKKISKNKDINLNYLQGIAKNKLKDYYRFHYKNKIISFFQEKEEMFYETVPDDFDLEKTISNKYDTELVWKYLRKKKVIVSKIFYLFYNLDLTILEIASLLELSESNVKHYLYRTLKELNKYLESGER